MKIGWIGLGKLGFPGALTLNVNAGHDVTAYDTAAEPYEILAGSRRYPHVEAGVKDLLGQHKITTAPTLGRLVDQAEDGVFIAVPTPHPPEYDGTQPAPPTPVDFDYTHVRQVLEEISHHLAHNETLQRHIYLVSTVAPGTCRNQLLPLLDPDQARLVYHPWFISLGTVIHDIHWPKITLVGADPRWQYTATRKLSELYYPLRRHPGVGTIRTAYNVTTGYTTAEITKMAYNTQQTLQITLANHLAEICDAHAADVDTVTNAIGLPYRAGMVDGGACRPRDLHIMALAENNADTSARIFNQALVNRDMQASAIAGRLIQLHDYGSTARPIVILGTSYKPETDFTIGSPAALICAYLEQHGYESVYYDPRRGGRLPDGPAVYLAATRNESYNLLEYPPGSDIIDPWGVIDPDKHPGVCVDCIGRTPDPQ